METFFLKQSLFMNIKIKVVTKKKKISRDISYLFS